MSTSIRDLRNHFPKVRRMLEASGEVILTEKGKPRYRLPLLYAKWRGGAASCGLRARLNSYQPKSLTDAQSRALEDENRGER